jgi:hypothetical protein
MNKELLLQVKKHILARPSRVRMSNYVITDKQAMGVEVIKKKGRKYFNFAYDATFANFRNSWGESYTQTVPSCGIVGCIAGWTVLIHDGVENYNTQINIPIRALELLQLPMETGNSRLFHVSKWPMAQQNAYCAAKSQRKRAQIIGQVIDLFVAGDGRFAFE